MAFKGFSSLTSSPIFKGSGDGVSKLSNRLNRHVEGTYGIEDRSSRIALIAMRKNDCHTFTMATIIMEEERRKAHFVSLAVDTGLVGIQYRRYTSKHLKDKRFSVHQVKLLNGVFYRSSYQFVSLMSRVQL